MPGLAGLSGAQFRHLGSGFYRRKRDGDSKYTIIFERGATPPVDAFWSITLYDAQGFQVANSLNRFAVSSWMPFKYDPDGWLTLYFQNESPGKDKEANWLPAPKGHSI